MKSQQPARTGMVLVHGGAGSRKPTAIQKSCLAEALHIGLEGLHRDQSSLEAVESMIRLLEESGLFNAGSGSRRQLDGIQRMDASLMEGKTLKAGAVAGIERVRSPISAARLVMEHTSHVLLIGEHATRFARRFRLEPSSPRVQATSRARQRLLSRQRSLPNHRKGPEYDTVGAVALDRRGTVATGASTGGIPRMQPGRVGDSPLIGSGIYADNMCGAVALTGVGETIMRLALAKHIAMELKAGARPRTATYRAFKELTQRMKGTAGALVVTPDGRFFLGHTTPWMGAGYWNGRGKPVVADRFR